MMLFQRKIPERFTSLGGDSVADTGETRIGSDAITEMRVGEMGIKQIFIGAELHYERSGAFFYLELRTEED